MARSWVRFYYTESAYYDYEDVWDLSIDPIALTGAEMFTQEGRKAQFSLYVDDVWLNGGLTNSWGEVPDGLRFIRRAWVEIWDTPRDSDTARVIFAGFLLKDSITYDVKLRTIPGTNYQSQLKIGKVTVYDWLSIFVKIHENSRLSLTSGMYLIQQEMQSLFNDYSIDWQWPLNNCAVGYQLNIYPDFGTIFNNEEIWRAVTKYDTAYYRLFLTGQVPTFEIFKFKRVTNTLPLIPNQPQLYHHFLLSEYTRYYIYGSQVIFEWGLDNNDEILFSESPLYPATWTLANQLTHFGIVPSTWDGLNTLTIENATYNVLDQATPGNPIRIVVSGTLTRTVVNIIEDTDVGLLEWVNYLLNTQYASLIQNGNTPSTYVVTNRGFYPSVETTNLDTINAQYFEMTVESDTSRDAFTYEPTFVTQAPTIKNQINEYLNRTLNNRPNRVKIVTDSFITYPGKAVSIPSLDVAQLYITSKSFDFNSKLTTYEGR